LESTGEHASQARAAGLHPAYVTPAEAKVLDRVAYLREARQFCRDNPDGFEGGGGEKSFTREQIARRFAAVDEELMDLMPQAADIRRKLQAEIDEDLKLGRELRQKKAAATRPQGEQARKPPAVPGMESGKAGASVAAGAKKSAPSFGAERLMKEGVTDESLQKAYENIA
jgi:hypothetical protein